MITKYTKIVLSLAMLTQVGIAMTQDSVEYLAAINAHGDVRKTVEDALVKAAADPDAFKRRSSFKDFSDLNFVGAPTQPTKAGESTIIMERILARAKTENDRLIDFAKRNRILDELDDASLNTYLRPAAMHDKGDYYLTANIPHDCKTIKQQLELFLRANRAMIIALAKVGHEAPLYTCD